MNIQATALFLPYVDLFVLRCCPGHPYPLGEGLLRMAVLVHIDVLDMQITSLGGTKEGRERERGQTYLPERIHVGCLVGSWTVLKFSLFQFPVPSSIIRLSHNSRPLIS